MAFILPPLPKEPSLTTKQLERLSSICDNAGQVFLGVLVLTPLINSVDESSISMVGLGIIVTLTFWSLSLYFSKKSEIKYA